MDADAGKPVVETEVPAPIAEVPAAPAVEPVAAVQAEQSATDPAPAVDPSPVPAAGAETKPAEAPEVPKSLLDKHDDKIAEAAAPADAPKAEDKPAEEVKAEPAPAAEEPNPAEPAPEPDKPAIEEPAKLDPINWFAEDGGIKVPELISLNDESRAEVTAALELSRTDPRAGAQAMMDLGAKMAEQISIDMTTKMWSTFADTRKGWETRTMADPALGGAGHDTAMGVVARMRDQFITRAAEGTPEHAQHMADWKEFMDATGAGDHPALLRLLHNVGRAFDEGRAPPADPRPPKDLGRKPGQRKGLNYDHPTSQPGN